MENSQHNAVNVKQTFDLLFLFDSHLFLFFWSLGSFLLLWNFDKSISNMIIKFKNQIQ